MAKHRLGNKPSSESMMALFADTYALLSLNELTTRAPFY